MVQRNFARSRNTIRKNINGREFRTCPLLVLMQVHSRRYITDSDNSSYITQDCLSVLGVCGLNDKLYCVGGWNGQVGMKQCEMYDPLKDTWVTIAPLKIGKNRS